MYELFQFMSPFSESLEKFRRNRKLSQAALASVLDVRANYISALESGNKVPSVRLLEKIVLALELSDAEAEELRKNFSMSGFSLKVPPGALREEFELVFLMQDYVGRLTVEQVEAIILIMKMGDAITRRYKIDLIKDRIKAAK